MLLLLLLLLVFLLLLHISVVIFVDSVVAPATGKSATSSPKSMSLLGQTALSPADKWNIAPNSYRDLTAKFETARAIARPPN